MWSWQITTWDSGEGLRRWKFSGRKDWISLSFLSRELWETPLQWNVSSREQPTTSSRMHWQNCRMQFVVLCTSNNCANSDEKQKKPYHKKLENWRVRIKTWSNLLMWPPMTYRNPCGWSRPIPSCCLKNIKGNWMSRQTNTFTTRWTVLHACRLLFRT